MHVLRSVGLLLLGSSLLACESESREASDSGADSSTSEVSVSLSSDSGVSVAASAGAERSENARPTFREGEDGSVSMSSTNGAFVMSLRHDSVVVAFSDSIRESVKKELRESTKDQDSATSAIGDMIQGVVQKSVAATMTEVFDKARGFPVSALRDVQYEDGGIRFDYIKKPTWTFDSMKSDDGPLMEQFHPADAARFVGAVRARMRK